MGMFLKTSLITALLAGTVAAEDLADKGRDLLAETRHVVDTANVTQLSTALELYRLDHGAYPDAADGSRLVAILEDDGYIRTRPHDPSVFRYVRLPDRDDYRLSVE